MTNGYIIVTGATRGIGAAIARELAAGGARVAGLTRSGETAAGEGFVCDVARRGRSSPRRLRRWPRAGRS